jgi:outer membrane protein assembly factor BamB
MKRAIYCLGACAVALLSATGPASDWPQFRGPNGSGVSDEKGLPVEWGPNRNVRWKASLPGRGLSCPIITKGRVIVTACSGFKQGRLHVLCYREDDGTKLWERQFASTGNTQCHQKTCMAAPTPATDGKAVYALFATGDLAALDLDGNQLWYRSLVRDYPDITNQVGMASSPVLSKGVLLVPMENAGDSFAAGIDTRTGKNLWKVSRTRCINWVTPLVVERDGRAEAIFQTTTDVTAYEPATGKVLWSRTGRGTAEVASPVQGEGLLFIAGGELVALKQGKDGGRPEVVWKSSRLPTGITTPLYHEGRVYGFKTNIGLTCLDARNGRFLWQQRVRGQYSASPVIGDGKAYLASEEGMVTVVQLGQEPKIVGENDMNQTLLATPAIAGGAIYLRSDQTLFCIGPKKK